MAHFFSEKELQHLYWRAGFGLSADELKKNKKYKKEKVIDRLFRNSEKENLLKTEISQIEVENKSLNAKQRNELQLKQVAKLEEITLEWMQQMQTSEEVLRERMILFFTNHFSAQVIKAKMTLDLHHRIRKNALGNFGEMLLEVSKSPSIITFLNNKQNKKKSPNENFAREVMELFTLGRDSGYSEKDIKEAARAFTGWSTDQKENFKFKPFLHDEGQKTVLGQTGNFKGQDIIRILLQQKQTATYLSEKMYKYFVNPIVNKDHVSIMATAFYNSRYDIKTVLKTMFLSNWFYEEKNIGVKIKSPIDLIVGLGRQFKVAYENPKSIIFLQKKLNQRLFYPPNVAGWPGDKHWIDNSTLMLRLKFPAATINKGIIDVEDNAIIMDSMSTTSNTTEGSVKPKLQNGSNFLTKKIKATANWDLFLISVKGKSKKDLIDFLLQPKLSAVAKKILEASKEENTKHFTIQLVSLPEYQLC